MAEPDFDALAAAEFAPCDCDGWTRTPGRRHLPSCPQYHTAGVADFARGVADLARDVAAFAVELALVGRFAFAAGAAFLPRAA